MVKRGGKLGRQVYIRENKRKKKKQKKGHGPKERRKQLKKRALQKC